MTDSEEISIKMTEILVALDYSSHSRAALESAAYLAQLMEARIHGLFVHDSHWLRISKISSLSEIDELTGRISPLGRESIEKKIRDFEKAIKEHFEQITKQYKLAHTLSTVKGVVTEKVLEAAKDVDLITVGSKGRSFHKKSKLGSTASSIIRDADKPVLILQEKYQLNKPVIVLFDESQNSIAGLKIATSVALRNGSQIIAIDMTDTSSVNKSLETVLGEAEMDIRIIKLDQLNMGKLTFLLSRLRGGLLVIPKSKRFTKTTTVEYLLESADCPILLAS